MTRTLATIAMLVILPSSAQAAEGWRPAHPDRLASLDAAMAPALSAFKPTFDAVVADLTIVTAYVSFAGIDASVADMQARLDAASRLAADVQAIQDLAASGIATLDAHGAPDPCYADYAALTRAGWLLAGDSADSLRANDAAAANQQIGAATYLLVSDYPDLVHGVAVEACA